MANKVSGQTDGLPFENPTSVQERFTARGGESVLELIQEKSGRSRTSSKQLMGSGRVSIDGKITTKATEILSEGAMVTVHSGIRPKDFQHPLLEKVWEDDDLLLVYKKAGISTVNTSHKDRTQTAIWILSQAQKKDHGAGAMLFMLNRLDRNSEGYVLFAKNIPAKEAMVKQWGNLLRDQRFVLCLEGDLPEKEGELVHETQVKDTKATKRVTANYKVLKRSPKGGMLIVELHVSGSRLYNLRALIKENDLAIFGDIRSKSDFTTKDKIGLVQTKISFLHPKTKELLSFERKFPTHFYEFLKADKGLSQSVSLEKRHTRDDEDDNFESPRPYRSRRQTPSKR